MTRFTRPIYESASRKMPRYNHLFLNAYRAVRRLLCKCAWLSQRAQCVVAVSMIFWSALALPADSNEHNSFGRCKYSVRDVAFVDVHTKPWQLQLIRPASASDSQFQAWNKTLRSKLPHSNVGHIWFDADSPRAVQMRKSLPQMVGRTPHMRMVGPDEKAVPPLENLGSSFEDQLKPIFESPVREQITDSLVDSLCVILCVESANSEHNERLRKTVSNSIEQLNRQMWMLEKPTDHGPVLVSVSHEQKQQESWLLRSLEIEHDDTSTVAIIYGQGRRLGDLLVGDEITQDNIVRRASICGQSCECDLDRNWLYGQQMIHVWSKNHERLAEESLTFDPKSAFVVAEVAQIIRKNSLKDQAEPKINLGNGLLIHDLDTLSPTDEPDSAAIQSDQSNQKENPDRTISENKNSESKFQENSNLVTTTPIPWKLIGILIVCTVVVGAWLSRLRTT